jgi:aspartate-semialdehyde dehydrogenase
LLVADDEADASPTAVDAVGQDEVLVGRVRSVMGKASGLNYWLIADNIHAGTALNVVRIAKVLSIQ